MLHTKARREKMELRKKESLISQNDRKRKKNILWVYIILDYYYSIQFSGYLLACFKLFIRIKNDKYYYLSY